MGVSSPRKKLITYDALAAVVKQGGVILLLPEDHYGEPTIEIHDEAMP